MWSHLISREGHRADLLEHHQATCTGQPGDQAQPAQACERQVLLSSMISIQYQGTCLEHMEKAVHVVYPDFSKAFVTVSHSIPGESGTPWLAQVHPLLD